MKSNTTALHPLLEEHMHLLPSDAFDELRPFLNEVSEALCERIELLRVAEERNRLSELKYRGIIEGLDIGIIETDLDGRVKKVYNSFTSITGYTEDDLLGNLPADVFLDEGMEERVAEVHVARERGEAGVWEANILHKSGRKMTVMISGAPIREFDGTINGSIGLHFDITAHIEREEALRQARESAEAALKSQEVFLANISHELRTPMNAILGMTEILKERTDSKNLPYLDGIKSGADELLKIINDLLDIARINSGQFSLEMREVDVYALIERSHLMMNIGADAKQVQLDYVVDEVLRTKWYKTDPVRLNQIIINLVSNAIKFTGPGGHVQLEANLVNENDLSISVIDTGIGIEQDKMDAIFESFRQEDDSVTRKYGGTGLGLTITRQLVELLGGSLSVESKKGVGSTFVFYIPVEPVDTRSEVSVDFELNRFDAFHFLLAEDNEMNRLVAKTIFEGWGAKVTEAENGAVALQKLKEMPFDIVFMDLQMPELGGLDAVRKLRNELKSLVPVVALTANALPKERDDCFRAGMDACVSKPFETKELNAIIERTLSGRSEAVLSESEQHWQSFLDDLDPIKRQAFKESLRQSLELALPKIRLAYENADLDDLAQVLHSIRPVVTYAGAILLARQLGVVELAANQRRLEVVMKCQKTLVKSLKELAFNLKDQG